VACLAPAYVRCVVRPLVARRRPSAQQGLPAGWRAGTCVHVAACLPAASRILEDFLRRQAGLV